MVFILCDFLGAAVPFAAIGVAGALFCAGMDAVNRFDSKKK